MHAGVDGFAHDWIRETTDGSWSCAPPEGAGPIRRFGTDSRGDLIDAAFVALRGARHDGHDHLESAVAAGARLLVVERGAIGGGGAMAVSVPVLAVDDTLVALQRLGAAHRRRLARTTVIAITGSAGKTTTRRLVHAALSTSLRGTQSPKSFNNAYGVPLTLLAASMDDRFLVVEIGTNAPGEIERLGRLVEPDVVVITGVGRAHLGGFGSIEAIAEEKASLLRCRRPGSVAIVRDGVCVLEPHLRGVEPLIRYGGLTTTETSPERSGSMSLRLLDRELRGDGQRIVVEGPLEIDLPLAGEHNAFNALAAVAVARTLGVPDAAIAEGLAAASGEAMRLDTRRVRVRDRTGAPAAILLVDDAYNANPESMVAGLRTFIELSPGVRRRIVVLGRMLELGDDAEALHTEVVESLIRLAERDRVDRAVLVGPEWMGGARILGQSWGQERVVRVDDLDDRGCVELAATFGDGDAVFLKASRGVALERIAKALDARAGDAERGSGLVDPSTPLRCAGGTG